MLSSWSTIPQRIDPVALQIGDFNILWYSVSYILAFFTAYFFLKIKIKKELALAKKIFKNDKPFESLETLFLISIVGLFLGAKIGFVIFYDLSNFIAQPIQSISPFSNGNFTGISGLSFHGAVIGIILAGVWFCKKYSLKFFDIANFIIIAVPLGYFWGRLGNFMNGELYGRITKSSIGMCFPKAGNCTNELRHPSQLYEAFGEGLVLFLVLWFLQKTKLKRISLFPAWLILYGLIRFLVEFFREPDAHIGFAVLNLTTGQILCFCMVLAGLVIIFFKKGTAQPQ